MIGMKSFFTYAMSLILAALLSCGSKSRQAGSVFYDDLSAVEQNNSDTVTVPIKEETPKEDIPSIPVSSSSSHSRSSHNYDNMRGFDPASEDDMEDNGMSRYMDNYDEEGWD